MSQNLKPWETGQLNLEQNEWGPMWTLKLNKYQRDNLLWLMQLVMEGKIPGANTGDWVAEFRGMLADQTGKWPSIEPGDRPNFSIEAYSKLRSGDPT